MALVKIKKFNALIDNRPFFGELAIKKKKTLEKWKLCFVGYAKKHH